MHLKAFLYVLDLNGHLFPCQTHYEEKRTKFDLNSTLDLIIGGNAPLITFKIVLMPLKSVTFQQLYFDQLK